MWRTDITQTDMCFQHDEQKMHREFYWEKLLTTTFRTHFDIKKNHTLPNGEREKIG